MGDEATNAAQGGLAHLRQWYEEYLVVDSSDPSRLDHSVILALEEDVIDSAEIEQQISRTASKLEDFEYFCAACRAALDNWPELDSKAYIRTWDTISMEAAARRNCRFCIFLLHLMMDTGRLQTFRRIELRLKRLGKCQRFTVSHASPWCRYATIDLPGRAGLPNYTWPHAFRVNDLGSTGE